MVDSKIQKHLRKTKNTHTWKTIIKEVQIVSVASWADVQGFTQEISLASQSSAGSSMWKTYKEEFIDRETHMMLHEN